MNLAFIVISYLILVSQSILTFNFLSIPHKIYLCSENDDISKIVDLSNIEVIYTDEGTQLNGYVEWKYPLRITDILAAKIKVDKYRQGQWIDSGFQLTRINLCDTIFKQSEFWYPIVQNIVDDEKKCPPQPGSRFTFDHQSTTVHGEDPVRDAQGLYRAFVNITTNNVRLCFIVEIDHNIE